MLCNYVKKVCIFYKEDPENAVLLVKDGEQPFSKVAQRMKFHEQLFQDGLIRRIHHNLDLDKALPFLQKQEAY